MIEPRSFWQLVDWRALWRSRELLAILPCRDISVRCRQTVLGIAWAVLQPLLQLVAFWLFCGRQRGARGKSRGRLSLFLLPWQLFSTGVGRGTKSVVSKSTLVRKVDFPRLVVPLAALGIVLVTIAVGVGLSARVAEFRNFRNITGLLLQVWMVFFPVAHPLSIVPAR